MTARFRLVRHGLTVSAALLFALGAVARADERPGAIRLWDTVTPLRAGADLAQRQGWRAVTPAASRHVRGDLVVEAQGLVTAFASRVGEVRVASGTGPARDTAALRPTELRGRPARLAPTVFAEQDGVVMAQADFRAGADSFPITFTFKGGRVVSVRPEGRTQGITVAAPVDLALVPSFVGDDLIYDPREYRGAGALAVPSEHFLLGLLTGENGVLVTTWQEAMPSVQLELSPGGTAPKSIEAISFEGGKSVCLAVLSAPGIWHREILKPEMLERDVPSAWKPPFPATWLTQLSEDDLKTTFEFQHEKQEHWRGGIGSYTVPVWFSGEKAMFSLGKQIPPEGEAIIYFLERSDDTPEGTVTPIEIAANTLAGDVRVGVLDVEGRPAWWPMRPDAAIGGETCNVTDVLKAIFDAGQEVDEQLFVRAGAEDMIFHLEVMFERNGRYYPFAKNMLAYLDSQAKAKPDLAPYLRELRSIPEQMIATYDNTRDTLRDMDYARKLEAETIALAGEKRPGNAERMMAVKQEWIGMGGAAEELSRREHTFARKLYQQAAYLAAGNPKAIPIAEEIRRRTKQCLQRPDSYEIWANY